MEILGAMGELLIHSLVMLKLLLMLVNIKQIHQLDMQLLRRSPDFKRDNNSIFKK